MNTAEYYKLSGRITTEAITAYVVAKADLRIEPRALNLAAELRQRP